MNESSVNWERDVYAKGEQLNRWPYSDVVSAVIRATRGQDRSTTSVLEVGCGAGNNLWFLAAEGYGVTGIDRSISAISFARSRLQNEGLQASLAVGDIDALPWPDRSYDIVLDRGALTQNTHERIVRILAELYRVLRPDGRLFSFTLFGLGHPDRVHGDEVAYHAFDHFREGQFRRTGLTSFFSREDVERLFGSFRYVSIHTHIITGSNGDVLDEQYSVDARK